MVTSYISSDKIPCYPYTPKKKITLGVQVVLLNPESEHFEIARSLEYTLPSPAGKTITRFKALLTGSVVSIEEVSLRRTPFLP